MLYGCAGDAVETRISRIAVSMLMTTAPGICFQSAMTSPTAAQGS
jgi:hypothetical protein